MNNYELLYIIDNAVEEEARDVVIEKLNTVITDMGGSIDSIDKWGTKKFAYPINFKNEGYYVLLNFQAPANLPLELERVMKIHDAVVRFMIIKK